MNSKKVISIGRTAASLSFTFGTLIIILFYSTGNIGFGFLGLIYGVIAGIINLGIIGFIIFKSYQEPENKKKFFRTVGLMLLNIPFFFLYCWFAIILLNTLRVTFVNNTATVMNNIRIEGCEERVISKLLIGQSKTVWINIPNDCVVTIRYKINGQIKTEDVSGYVSSGMGHAMIFKIGTNQKPYDQEL